MLLIAVRILVNLKAGFVNGEEELHDWDVESQSPCGWMGVNCNNVTFEVVALNLSELALGGEISPSIGLLGSLQILDLSGNNISGQIPVEICNCTSLTHLDLSSNNLGGEIPYLLSQLQLLEVLNLRNNRLSGPIPSSFAGLSNLRHLDMQFNSLSGPIPPLLYWSETLQYLMLKSNQLTGGLSDDMCKLTQLAYFNVRDNKLAGPLPAGIGNCTSFQILDLSYNSFSGEIPYNIGYLQVSTLSLEANQLTGGIPDVLGLMQALVILDLSNNKLEGQIPPILGNLTSLTKLYLYNNNISGPIPVEFGNMSRLNYLELSGNRLTGEIPSELSYLTGLFELDLSNNQLSGTIPENISSLAALNLLNLHGNQLNGSISPALQQLTNLTLLNLASNNFTGSVPEEIGMIVNLDILNLSRNSLSGQIPSSISNLEHLLSIDLHDNKLNGTIPMALGNLKSLGFLDLSQNHLQGPIPLELGQLLELSYLNISYNHLSGTIPRNQVFSRFPTSSYFGNPLLCLNSTFSCGLNPQQPREATSQRPGALGPSATWGITISALILLALLTIVGIRYAQPHVFLKASNKTVQGPPSFVIFHLGMAPQSYEEMMRITENLSEKYVIGRGGSSTVYRCSLKNGHPIAIKKLYNQFSQNVHEFETELRTLGNIKHRNLVTLRGFSMSSIGNFLFYDYMENGSLYDHLHGHVKNKLDWNTRLKIASGAAQGLAYLHKDCKPQVVHRDVKSCNILLDVDMEPHVADFGIAKNIQPARTHTSTHVLGTIGYIDPEYAQTSRLNEKSDVYSFGIVLLEILANKKAVDDEVNLLDWVMSQLEGKTMQDVIDPHVRATCKDVDALEKTLKLALLCSKLNPSHRPSMYDVSQVLLSLLPPQSSDDFPSSKPYPPSNQRRYVDMYSSKQTEAISLSNSSSGDTLLYQFKEVISGKMP
uniref:non-specific serine/threonine protein kinase n=1 Tax=Physcomitrium patens TaxID=3218 RepID=A0A7I4BPG7_PHYPA